MPSSARRRARAKLRARGVTLIEVLLVVALIAGLTGMVISGSGALGGMRRRAAASLILNSVRTGLTRANSMGHPVRLVFDLDAGRLRLEESQDRMLRVRSSTEGAKAGAQAATEAEKAATEFAREIVQGPRAPTASFTPVPGFAQDADEPGQGRELGTGVRFLQVQTEHDLEPRTEGHAYLYFWPGGGTERAAIQIARQGESEGVTVLVSALTGRAKLQRGRIELEEGRRELDFQERDEP